MIRSEGQLRLAFFKLEVKDLSLAEVVVPYNDRIDDDPDNHSLVMNIIIDGSTFKFDVAWDGEIIEVKNKESNTKMKSFSVTADHILLDLLIVHVSAKRAINSNSNKT